MKQYIRYGIIALLFVIQVLFLIMIMRENQNSYLLLIFFSSLIILSLYTYLKTRKTLHNAQYEYESYKTALWVPIGALSSFALNHEMGLGAVLAAAIVGTIASFIPNINKHSNYLKGLPTAIYCGAFVGMSNTNVANGFWFVLVASFFTAVLLIISKSLLAGVGGKLGALAFTGVALTYLILFIAK